MMLLHSILALAASNPTTPPVAELPAEYMFSGRSAPSSLVQDDEDESPFSYSYIEIGIYATDLDTANESTDAWRGRASLGLLGFLNIFLDYSAESYDFGSVSIDNDTFGLGAGAHFSLTNSFDLEGELSWVTDDISSEAAIEDGEGWTGRVGGRWMILPTDGGGLEAKGGYRWIERDAIFSNDSFGAWDLGGRFHFLNAFSVGAEYQFLDDDSRWGLDARFSF